MRETSVL